MVIENADAEPTARADMARESFVMVEAGVVKVLAMMVL